MKAVPLIAALAGLAVIAVLIAVFGVGAVFRSLSCDRLEGFAVICLIQLALIAVMGLAWRGLVPRGADLTLPVGPPRPRRRLRSAAALAGRRMRPRRTRIIARRNVGFDAAASTIVDLTVEFFAKLAYTALGLVLLVRLRPGSQIALPLAGGLVATGLVAAGFVTAQHRGFGLFDRLAGILGRGWAERIATGSAALHAAFCELTKPGWD